MAGKIMFIHLVAFFVGFVCFIQLFVCTLGRSHFIELCLMTS